jgi:predicted transcriptional regulator
MSGLTSLHKILKDETRQRILLLLNERGSLSYTDLMTEVGIESTGKLNYHLKILNGLIAKNESGQYSITEKGKLAIRLMEEFCEKKSQSQQEASFPKAYFIVVGLFSAILLILLFGLYVTGIINLEQFVEYIATSVLGIVFLVVAERVRRKRAMLKSEKQMLGAKITIILAGAWAGGVILFFGGGLIIGLIGKSLRISLGSFDFWVVTSFTVGSIIGGLIGYLIFKRSRYSKISYYEPF